MMSKSSEAHAAIELIQGMDIYLLDQVMKHRFAPGSTVLDAGCGGGRNVTWFLHAGYNVYGVDSSAGAVQALRAHAARVAPSLPADNFRSDPVEKMSFPDASFDYVLSIAVLHFARDENHFDSMLREMWRVLRPGGVLFARLASTIGIEALVQPLDHGRYLVPDGSTRFLVNMDTLLQLTQQLSGRLLEPIKTVNVQNKRCMTTWVLQKK